MSDISKLASGFRVFKSTTYQQQKDVIHHLLEQGHKPTTMVISCCDLRISPSQIFSTNPGELYVVNNMGGIVPKYQSDGVHGIVASIEYAVENLNVENVLILGHAKCDSIKEMLLEDSSKKEHELSKSMKTWFSTVEEARLAVKTQMADKSFEEQEDACEKESLIISLHNLMTYPSILKRLKKDQIEIFAWHFDIETGEIMAFDPKSKFFEPIS